MDKKTPFYSFHIDNDAKLVSFAGYSMPIQYVGVNIEHNHVRNHVGLFDVSHMAQITISGEQASQLIQKICTNNIQKLCDGKIQYSCMLNEDGGFLDDLLVYRFSNNYYMLVVNASNADTDFEWIKSHNNMGCEVINKTSSRALLALQGPKSKFVLQALTDINLDSIPYYSFQIGLVAGCPGVIVSNTGYTGSGGFELYLDEKWSKKIWSELFSISDILKPIGLAARDTLRLEMGYCLYGNDIDSSRTPIEAGLSWIVDMKKQFIGKSKLMNQISDGVREKLIGFILTEKGVPRKGYQIIDENETVIGIVTSGTMSPFLSKPIGMGYVLSKEAYVDNHIFILIRGKKIKAKIVKPPFYAK